MHSGSTKRIWQKKSYDADKARAIADSLGICMNTAALLCVRGVDTPKAAEIFLKKESCSFYDPFLMKDMDRAADRLVKAIENGEYVCVYGDYDVDGISATSLMCMYLQSKGVKYEYYIPDRNKEGYGVNKAALEKIIANGARLIVTVDTGVTAVDEVDFAKSMGVDVVITDHHECKGRLPDTVVVNPFRNDCKYPYKSLAGVGVVFKLICAIEMRFAGQTQMSAELLRKLLTEYAQIVALGTVADVMPATDENRLIISIGLSMMQSAPDHWCHSLLDMNGFYTGAKDSKQITTSTISYTIAPRINAAGRIGDADIAVKLLLTESKAESEAYSAELCEYNRKRQQLENEILDEATEMLKDEPDDEPFIILASDNWNQGIIGIVASRICEKYCRPCILITFSDEDTLSGKGSGRSIRGVNIYDALENCKDCLIKFGGHELAAGLSVERDKLDEFKKRINDYTRDVLGGKPLETVTEIDREPEVSEITLSCAKELRLLEPFGYGNPSPLFLITDAVISDIVPMSNDKHCRFTLTKDGMSFQAVYFGISQSRLCFSSGDGVDAVFSMEVNNYNKSEKLQLIIKDITHSKSTVESIDKELALYEKVVSGKSLSAAELDGIIPSREDFKTVYLHINRLQKHGSENINYPYVARKLSGLCNADIGICKLRVILDIFKEKELIEYEQLDKYTLAVRKSDKIPQGEKVSLDGSSILCALREMKKQA